MTVRPHHQDPDHRYVVCDGCSGWGIRLDPIEVEIQEVDGTITPSMMGDLLTEDEGFLFVAGLGWKQSDCLDGNIRRVRDLCPRCQRVVVA